MPRGHCHWRSTVAATPLAAGVPIPSPLGLPIPTVPVAVPTPVRRCGLPPRSSQGRSSTVGLLLRMLRLWGGSIIISTPGVLPTPRSRTPRVAVAGSSETGLWCSTLLILWLHTLQRLTHPHQGFAFTGDVFVHRLPGPPSRALEIFSKQVGHLVHLWLA